jgi:hypothetical protein
MLSSTKGVMLRRSKSSILCCMTSSGSECSSPGSINSPPACRLLQPIKRSASSPLYLKGHSEASLCSQMGDIVHAEKPEDASRMMQASSYTAVSAPSPLALTDAGSITLVQCLLLVAMALQIPNYLDEIIEILELHIHSFPLLIVLGVFPSLYLKKKQHKKYSSSNLSSRSTSSMPRSADTSSSSLAGIEEYYRNCAESDSAFAISSHAKRTSTHNPTDDWGHFADFDESMQDQDASFLVPLAPRRRASLSPLVEETEHEE